MYLKKPSTNATHDYLLSLPIGKTLIAKTLARMIDVPLVVTDATCLTQAGYVGEDVESLLYKLYAESGMDLERTKKGIVYIDEVDKIARKSDSRQCDPKSLPSFF